MKEWEVIAGMGTMHARTWRPRWGFIREKKFRFFRFTFLVFFFELHFDKADNVTPLRSV